MATNYHIKMHPSKVRSYGGKPLLYAHIVKKGMTYREANEIVQEISDANAKKFNGTIYAALKYKPGWMDMRGGGKPLGATITLWNYEDYDDEDVVIFQQDTFDEIEIWIDRQPKKKGGNDPHNDCLFNCIQWLLNKQLPPKYDTAEKLKKGLNLKRNDKISIDLMPTIEKIYHCNMNVTGDHCYISPMQYNRTIEFQLVGGHYRYQIDTNKRKVLHRGYYFSPLKSLYAYSIQDGAVELYDGKKTTSLSYDEFVVLKKKHRDDTLFYKVKNSADLIKEYEAYKRDAKIIFEASNKTINLYKSTIMSSHAKALFYTLSNSTMTPDPIGQHEATFLKAKGALIKAQRGTFENVYDYDINSMYGSLMTKFMYPMKKGDFVTLTTLPDKLEYGIYRCIVSPLPESDKRNMLFRFNEEHYYTHYDIMSARLLQLKVTLLQVDNNALIYSKDKLEMGSRLFKPTIDFLYDLKLKGIPRVKEIMNSLWGSLCEVQENKNTIREDEEFEAPANTFIRRIYRIGNKLRIGTTDRNFQYSTDYARIGVFLTSQARYHMARTLVDHLDDIIKVHTDGFLSLREVRGLPLSDKLGEWKMTQYKRATIENNNKKPLFVL